MRSEGIALSVLLMWLKTFHVEPAFVSHLLGSALMLWIQCSLLPCSLLIPNSFIVKELKEEKPLFYLSDSKLGKEPILEFKCKKTFSYRKHHPSESLHLQSLLIVSGNALVIVYFLFDSKKFIWVRVSWFLESNNSIMRSYYFAHISEEYSWNRCGSLLVTPLSFCSFRESTVQKKSINKQYEK